MNKLLTNLLTKTGTKFVFASALLVAIGAVSLSGINTAHAQSPSLNIERLADGSLKLTWSNISTDDARHNIFVDESGTITHIQNSGTVLGRYTFFANSVSSVTREQLARVNAADRVGVGGNDGANDRVDLQWVDVPKPTLTVERLVDNSIQLTWKNIPTTGTQYSIPIIESGTRNSVGLSTSAETLNIPDTHAQFSRVNGAEKICVIGTDAEGVILPGEALCKSIPAELSGPSLTVERLVDNSLKLSWKNIRTNELAKSFQIFVITGTTETRINAALFFDVNEAVIDSDYFAFNQINNAEQVGIAGTRSDGSGGIEYLDKTFQPVPAQKLPDVTFERQANGDINISWENIADTGSNLAIWVTEGGTNTKIVPNVSPSSSYPAPVGSLYYDRISNAERVGVSAIGASADAVTFTPVIPGIPTLSIVEITDTRVEISWNQADAATSYELFRDGVSVGTTAELTFIDTGLTPETDYVYTITSQSAIAQSSILSAELAITTLAAPAVTNAIRQGDNSVALSWERVVTDRDFYHILLIEETVTNKIADATSSPYTIPPSGDLFTRMYDADSIGVAGVDSSGNSINEIFTSVPNTLAPGVPILSIGEVTATTAHLSWAKTGGAVLYEVFRDNVKIHTTSNLGYTDDALTAGTEYTYHVVAFDDIDFNNANSNALTITTADPPVTLVPGTITDTSIALSWNAQRGATSYELFRGGVSVENGITELTFTDTSLNPATEYTYTITSTDGTTTSAPSAPLLVTTIAPLSFTYNDSGHTIVAFTPSVAGNHIIGYTIAVNNDETSVGGEIIPVTGDQVGTTLTAPLFTSHGYAGEVTASVGSAQYATGTIQVPPAPPTLVAGEITANTVEFSWTAPRGATSYELFRGGVSVENGITELTFTDTGLTAESDYSYTITSTDGTTTSAPSAELAVTTAEPSVTAVRQADNSILVTWEGIPTTSSYNISIFTGGVRLNNIGSSSTNSYTILTSDRFFDQVNNADQIAVGGVIAGIPGPNSFAPVPGPIARLQSDTGVSDTDRLTNENRVNIAGVGSGATWEYSTNGGTNWQDGSGAQFTVPEGVYADDVVRVRRTLNGMTSDFAGVPAFTLDTTPPDMSFSNSPAKQVGEEFRHNITFTEAVTGVDVGVFNLRSVNITVNSITVERPDRYGLHLTPSMGGYNLILFRNTIMDLAGNEGPADTVNRQGSAFVNTPPTPSFEAESEGGQPSGGGTTLVNAGDTVTMDVDFGETVDAATLVNAAQFRVQYGEGPVPPPQDFLATNVPNKYRAIYTVRSTDLGLITITVSGVTDTSGMVAADATYPQPSDPGFSADNSFPEATLVGSGASIPLNAAYRVPHPGVSTTDGRDTLVLKLTDPNGMERTLATDTVVAVAAGAAPAALDTSIRGIHTYTYTLSDAAGNTVVLTREVAVGFAPVLGFDHTHTGGTTTGGGVTLSTGDTIQVNITTEDLGDSIADAAQFEFAESDNPPPQDLEVSGAGYRAEYVLQTGDTGAVTLKVSGVTSEATGNTAPDITYPLSGYVADTVVEFTLQGEPNVITPRNGAYTEPTPGATSSKSGTTVAGPTIEGPGGATALDTSVPGIYTYTYTASDNFGNVATVSRTVTVTRAAFGISALDGDESGVSIKDAKFLYYAHALDLAPEDSTALATVLGPLTSAGEGELGGLLTAAKEELLVDLNDDEDIDAEDAAVLYYSFALEGSLGNGGSEPGLPDIKRAILGPLAGTNDMAAINTMLQKANRARGL